MILTQAEIQRSQTLVATAFPRFGHWEWVNEINDNYAGFCLWGQYTPEPKGSSSPMFFLTFDTFQESWKGHLTIGKPCYFWSSADFGDAHLLDTEKCSNLEDAIQALKRRIAVLVAALSG
jgi:hypothetical protein